MNSTPENKQLLNNNTAEFDKRRSNRIGKRVQLASPSGVFDNGDWLNLVTWEELPAWMKDNECIRTGYRPADVLSSGQCVNSIFRIHNESGNIWSHLLAFLAFLVLMVVTYSPSLMQHAATWFDAAVWAPFLAGALCCFGCSTSYHTMCCKDPETAGLWQKVDYMGIIALIWGSVFPIARFLFRHNTVAQVVYLSLITLLSIITAAVMLQDKFGEPRYRAFRASLFSALGLSGVAPAVHYTLTASFIEHPQPLYLLILMAALYLSGALIFATKFPERYFPGRCDIWGNSHQIFHVLVAAGAVVHYINCRQAFDWSNAKVI